MIVEMKKINETSTNEVIIYESGNPVLKVETGTTLKVIKLLYEAEYDRKSQILGVRPKQFSEGIPCIVTLDESKLNELTYDILVSDEGNEKSSQSSDDEETTTSRCIDCSRETWKTKRFTNVGMNTEISINPLNELDGDFLAQNEQKMSNKPQSPSPTLSNDETPRSNVNASLSKSLTPVTSLPSYSATAQKDYLIPFPTSVQNGNHHKETDRDRSRSSPSPTFGLDVYNAHYGTARYPLRSSLEPMHYEHFMPSHAWAIARSRYGHNRSPHHDHHSPDARRSPSRRSRSPISPRTGEGYPLHYHSMRDKHMHMLHQPLYERHAHHREGHRVPIHYEHTDETHYPAVNRDKMFLRHGNEHEVPPTLADFSVKNEKALRVVQPAEEPPVFVLPNDYDVVSGIDPRLASLQERRVKSPLNMTSKEKDLVKNEASTQVDVAKEERQSPQNSNGSESPKEGSGSPDSSTNGPQKLYCKICNSVFPTKSLLYKHLRGHTSDEKPFKCSECGQGFTLSSNLRQHRIIHRGYKPFQCEFCGKKFMRSNVYKQHRRIHTGEEMHKCSLCPSEFLQKYALLKHMKKNHDIDAVDN